MVDDITFNSIVIIESLADGEPKTGHILNGYVCSILEDIELPVSTHYKVVRGRKDFIELVEDLTEKALEGMLPILHIEAHGSQELGLYFSDDSTLSWAEFCELITPLNRATGFRLVVVVSACFGADLLTGVRLSKAAPCFAFIAPTEEIEVAEVMGRFRDFYRTMLKTLDAATAFDAMSSQRLTNGALIPQTAQNWFKTLMGRYLRENANPKGIKDLAMRQYLLAKQEGRKVDMRELKRIYKARLPTIIKDYFAIYFMLDQLTQNQRRFAPLWAELVADIDIALSH